MYISVYTCIHIVVHTYLHRNIYLLCVFVFVLIVFDLFWQWLIISGIVEEVSVSVNDHGFWWWNDGCKTPDGLEMTHQDKETTQWGGCLQEEEIDLPGNRSQRRNHPTNLLLHQPFYMYTQREHVNMKSSEAFSAERPYNAACKPVAYNRDMLKKSIYCATWQFLYGALTL